MGVADDVSVPLDGLVAVEDNIENPNRRLQLVILLRVVFEQRAEPQGNNSGIVHSTTQRRCVRRYKSAFALPRACPLIPGRTIALPSFGNSNDLYKHWNTSMSGTLRTFEVQLTSRMNPVTATMASDPLANRSIVDMQLVSEVRVLSSSRSGIIAADFKVASGY